MLSKLQVYLSNLHRNLCKKSQKVKSFMLVDFFLSNLYLEGVEVVDKVKDRRSSDKISKLWERRPESTIEFSPISGDEALELEDVLGVVDL